jgi:hypothetical protein
MSTAVRFRRGSTTEHSTFTGAEGEITVDTTKDTAVVHDGVTAGGKPLAREDGVNATGTWDISVTGNAATATALTTTLNVAGGGTGVTSLTANNVLLGNGTSALQVVAPNTAGNVLTSNGTTWQSTAIPIASTAEAQAGTNNTNFITPLRMREGFNASGSAPVYACRAWVNFDGTTSPPTIRASGNVSSVTKSATGRYRVNFSTAMPDANYCVGPGGSNSGSGPTLVFPPDQASLTTTYVDIRARDRDGIERDTDSCHISIFR